MKSFSSKEKTDGNLPVFVFPTELSFYGDNQSSHKQVLTLYNPYDFAVQFRVFCNNPTNYNVVESEGLIKKKCCIDIVIRVLDFHQVTRREDKFRVQLYEHGLSNIIGKTDVVALVMQTTSPDVNSSTPQRRRRRTISIREADEIFLQQKKESVIVQRSLPSIPVIILSLLCIIALMLPTYGVDPTHEVIPIYLHLTMNQKLIAAYVLGLVTMAILKS